MLADSSDFIGLNFYTSNLGKFSFFLISEHIGQLSGVSYDMSIKGFVLDYLCPLLQAHRHWFYRF